jgi:tetratricopeptide (TPR) repeat protein
MAFLVVMLGAGALELPKAEALFRAAVEQQRAGQKARETFQAARSAYLARLHAGEQPADLFRMIGNVHLLMGEVPEAIVWYRRGLRLAPWNASLHEALTAARERVLRPPARTLGLPPELAPSPGPILFLLAAGLWAIACLAFTYWRMHRDGRPWFALLALLGALAASIGYLASPRGQPVLAVVARPEVHLRRGDGHEFAPRYEIGLPAGTEAEALHRRGDWWLIQLRGGERGWVADADLLIDDPTAPATTWR